MNSNLEEYIKLMRDKENKYNCNGCPENRDIQNRKKGLPCGQQNCWLHATVRGDKHGSKFNRN